MRRLNLLPPERRAALTRAQVLGSVRTLLRIAAGGLLLWLLTGAALGIGLRIFLPAVSADTTRALEEQLQQYGGLRDSIEQHTILVDELVRADAEGILWSRVIDGVLQVLPPEVTVSRLTVDVPDFTITFFGTAPNRAAVVALEQQLRSLPWVTSVTSPRDNLIERVNPQYQFEVDLDAAAVHAL